jgi:hypothetical protein
MVLIVTNRPCLRAECHSWYQSHYGCNTSHTTIFAKTICLRVRIRVYDHIRTIVVLIGGKAKLGTFCIYFQNLLFYNDAPTTR